MNRLKASVVCVSALFAVAVAGNALAAGGHGGGHGGHGGWHGGHGHVHSSVAIGVGFGGPFWYGGYWPYYYGGYYAPYPYPYPAAVAAPAGPAAYVEQGQPAPGAAAGAYWYYCNESQAYYPYVNQCAGPWQRVSPQPPPQS